MVLKSNFVMFIVRIQEDGYELEWYQMYSNAVMYQKIKKHKKAPDKLIKSSKSTINRV